ANANGSATVTVTLTDDGTAGGTALTTAAQSFTITVTPVNDPPSGVNDPLSQVLEDSGARTIAFSALLANDSGGPTDESNHVLTITQVGGAVGGSVAIVGTDVIFSPTADYNGIASFVYTLRDNGQTNGADEFKTSTASVTFTITPVNDPPGFDHLGNQAAYDEDETTHGPSQKQIVPGWAKNVSM